MAIDPKVEADLVAASKTVHEANNTFIAHRQRWVEGLAKDDVVKFDQRDKAAIVACFPSDPGSPRKYELVTPSGIRFTRTEDSLSPWTEEDEAAELLDARRNTVSGLLAQADESTLAAIEDLLKKGSA